MSLKSGKNACIKEIVLSSKECIKTTIKPLVDNIDISINGSLTSRDLFLNILGMSVENRSVHSLAGAFKESPCETSMTVLL
jgi:putative transposase